MLDHNLLVQIIVVLLSSFAFLVILESYGYLALRVTGTLLKHRAVDDQLMGFVPRVFVGGVIYTLVFLAIGSIGLISSSLVIWLSCLVPVVLFLVGQRWRHLTASGFQASYHDNRYIIWGAIVFGLLTLPLWFRPATAFDPLWYHVTIPKLFLQTHTTSDQGNLIRYTLQPTLTYFWNLWPLSLPLSTAIATIISSAIQTFMLLLSLFYITRVGKLVWAWGSFHQFVVPVVVGGTYIGLTQLGAGGNDVIGLAYGLVAALNCFWLLRQRQIAWYSLTCAILIIVGLASIKIFFSILAALLLAYLVLGAWQKLPSVKRFTKLTGLLLTIFIITYLPWLIRSYATTGHLLYPVGAPGLNQEVYNSVGSNNPINHWTNFIFVRFYAVIWPTLTFVYSPLVLVGTLAVFHRRLKKDIADLWLVAFVSFWAIFFASIALQWRYYLPSASILVFLGLIVVIHWLKDLGNFARLVVWSTLLLLVLVGCGRAVLAQPDGYDDPSINHNVYIKHFFTTDHYLDEKVNKYYGYVQEHSPAGLTPNQTILVANIYGLPAGGPKAGSQVLATSIHNLAYINNPIFEPSINFDAFRNVHTAQGLRDLLNRQNIKYVLARGDLGAFCESIGVADPSNCSRLFRPVLRDSHWNVEWYALRP